jgi:glycogen debranching enzyme
MRSDPVIVSAGTRLVMGRPSGDLAPGTLDGFYASDTRFLSGLELSLDEERPEPLGSCPTDAAITSFYGQLGGTSPGDGPQVAVVRDRFVGAGWHEDLTLLNLASGPLDSRLRLTFATDFADVFEVRGSRVRERPPIATGARPGYPLTFEYSRDHFRVGTFIGTSAEATVHGRTLELPVHVESKRLWKTCLEVLPVIGDVIPEVSCVAARLPPPFAPFRHEAVPALRDPGPKVAPLFPDPPELETEATALRSAYAAALRDLERLTIEPVPGLPVVAAGMPWYMAVFGRDCLITALETRILGPTLMQNALRLFRGLQAHAVDPFRGAEPGKIPHEVRHGELSVSGAVPHTRYFGSVDATPLYALVFTETFVWTGDRTFAAKLLPSVEQALHWCDTAGDPDQDGFLEYSGSAGVGLRNQGWKDSDDAISFADGSLAEGPISVAEAQAYLYGAKRGMVRIYRDLGRHEDADRLESEAHALKVRFNEKFWVPSKGIYAMALDGGKRPVDGLGSNVGHALYCGIIAEERAERVVRTLLSEEMFSGWGCRTLSTEMPRYHPESYHNGSVWPHDTLLAALGMARYGHTEAGYRVAEALLDATVQAEGSRLPELFAGFSRRNGGGPIPYPAANSPQAWSSGAVVAAMELLAGLHELGGRLLVGAQEEAPRVRLRGVQFRGRRWRV